MAEDPYVSLARQTIETYVKTGEKIKVPRDLPEEMYSGRAGVFVSLKEDGRLRGCIGTIAPIRENIAREIIENAISAAVRDPRFHAVEPEELDRLVYSVDVLGNTEEIDSAEELDVKRYGVVVSEGAGGDCFFRIWRAWIRWRNRSVLQSRKPESGWRLWTSAWSVLRW